MALDFEAKIKEMALKYNTQLDTAKLKADADLDKMILWLVIAKFLNKHKNLLICSANRYKI